MSVRKRSRFCGYFSDHLAITAIAVLRGLKQKFPSLHLPSALAQRGHQRLFQASRTRNQAFDSGFAAGLFFFLSEFSQLDQELLVCSMMHASDDKNRAAVLRQLMNLVASWTFIK